jgi:hypothetical protein
MLLTVSLLTILVTGEGWYASNNLELYSKFVKFKFRTDHRLSWLRFLLDFFSLSRKMPSDIVYLFCSPIATPAGRQRHTKLLVAVQNKTDEDSIICCN